MQQKEQSQIENRSSLSRKLKEKKNVFFINNKYWQKGVKYSFWARTSDYQYNTTNHSNDDFIYFGQ